MLSGLKLPVSTHSHAHSFITIDLSQSLGE